MEFTESELTMIADALRIAADQYRAALNAQVTGNNSMLLICDYSQGIAHAPAYADRENHAGHSGLNIYGLDALKYEIEYGKRAGGAFTRDAGALPAPALADVLCSLCLDADALNYSSFEEWADASGYEADSRKAEKTYRECLELALKLRAILGDAKLAALSAVFQDY